MNKRQLNRISNIGIQSLLSAHAVYNALGIEGKETINRNPFLPHLISTSQIKLALGSFNSTTNTNPDPSLKSDIEPECAIVNVFRACNISIKFVSEELGQTVIGQKMPIYLGVIDGLDGTNEFKISGPWKGRQATMLGVFYGKNPNYEDYLFSGVIEHAQKKLYYAVRDKGAFVKDLVNLTSEPIFSSNNPVFNLDTLVSIDAGFDKWANITVINDSFISKLKGFNLIKPMASSSTYVDVASGKVSLGLECTRGDKKQNLEIGVAYGLVNEAGGLITDYDGRSIGDKKYLSFGHGKSEHFPIISAGNKNILKGLLEYLSH